MKRILTLLLCLVLTLGLFACGKDAVTDSGSGNSDTADVSDTEGNTDTSSEKTEDDQPKYVLFDPEAEHKFIGTDIINFSLVVYDLNLCDGDFQALADDDSCIIWEWKSREDPNCKLASKIIRSISGVKFRYSAYWKRDVVVACANFGWVGVIDYDACKLLWECQLPTGPHSVEMLPNGDVVVGSADGEGALIYFPLSAGITTSVHSIVSPSCHGVCWDPQAECLRVLGQDGVYSCIVENAGTAQGKLVKIEGSDCNFTGDRGGHAFTPVAGQPGVYWASAGKLWKYDSKTNTFSAAKSNLISGAIKGICSYEDNTVILSIAGLNKNNKYSWGSDGFRIFTRVMSEGRVKQPVDKVVNVVFKNQVREYYKIFPFTKDYQ